MIICIDETRVAEVAQYANRLNEIKEHSCKACGKGYENTLSSFQKMLQHPEDEVLICTENDKIVGVLALLVESEDKYAEAVGGVYAEDNYQEVALQFFAYLKGKYAGYRFDAAYPKDNIEAISFMEAIGANCIDRDLEMNLKQCDFKSAKSNQQVSLLSGKYYETFSKFHDRNSPNAYWSGERILAALDKFDVFIAVDHAEVIGAIVTAVFGGEKREIYFLEINESYCKEEYAHALLEEAIHRAFASGANELMVMVNEENVLEMEMYESSGFKKVDTCISYSIDSL